MREVRFNKTSEETIAYNNKMKDQMRTSRLNTTIEISTQKRENESKSIFPSDCFCKSSKCCD